MSHMIKKTYHLVDITKYIFCISIVILHSTIYYELGPFWGYITSKLISRLGVPFFFLCSGYFLGNKLTKNRNDNLKVIKHYSLRLLQPLIIFGGIGAFIRILNEIASGIDAVIIFQHIIKGIVFYPYGAMWFLLACIIGAWIWFLVSFLPRWGGV